jgi:hypothetical protein
MNNRSICGIALLLAGWSVAGHAADAEIVLENDGAVPVFARATDNLAVTPTTSMQERLDPGVGTTVAADLDGDGNYNLTWTVTDPLDPPTKTQSGNCKGARDAICYVDFSNPVPLAPPAGPQLPYSTPPETVPSALPTPTP